MQGNLNQFMAGTEQKSAKRSLERAHWSQGGQHWTELDRIEQNQAKSASDHFQTKLDKIGNPKTTNTISTTSTTHESPAATNYIVRHA